jgi:hypothetical protein
MQAKYCIRYENDKLRFCLFFIFSITTFCVHSDTVVMPRVYKHVIGKRRKRQYTAYAVAQAKKALEEGRQIKDISREFGIPKQTLSDMRSGKYRTNAVGGPKALSDAEEITMANYIATLGDWGFPVDVLEIRMLMHTYLCNRKKEIPLFRDNIPGKDWVRSFLKRQCDIVSERMCRNITSKRRQVSAETISSYFTHLQVTLDGVPPSNIINFDETCLSDDPGSKKFVFRRGCKYPERVINSTKAATSIMFACTADGKMLHPYVVYKADHLHDRWLAGGPLHVRYNRSRSGWFDHTCFADWFLTVVLPFCRRMEGAKVLIGDNLSSHFSEEVIAKCADNNIRFACLPPNTTHLCQPLDVSTFGPLKKYWRRVLTNWKMRDGRQLPTLPKEWFPRLLSQLLDSLKPTMAQNIESGFRKCGIVPFDPTAVLSRVTYTNADVLGENVAVNEAISEAVLDMLKKMQQGPPVKQRKKRLTVVPGKSISLADFMVHAFDDENDAENNGELDEHNDRDENAGNESDDSEPVIPLPIFPVPPKREAADVRPPRRIRQPVVWKDFIV